MNTSQQTVVIAIITDAFGVKGQVKLKSFADKPPNLLNYQKWLLDSGSGDNQAFSVESCRMHGKIPVAKLETIDDRDRALELKGSKVLIPVADLPRLPEGEYYHHELIGLTAVDVKGTVYGRINDILQTGANDVLVTTNDATHLIPYIPDVIVEVDLSQSIVRVDWFEDIES